MAEIRRTKTSDPELDAINVITQALAPLDRPACERVLAWADKRYVHPSPQFSGDGMKAATKFMDALVQTAQELDVSPPAKILDAMGLVVDQIRKEHKEAAELVNGS